MINVGPTETQPYRAQSLPLGDSAQPSPEGARLELAHFEHVLASLLRRPRDDRQRRDIEAKVRALRALAGSHATT